MKTLTVTTAFADAVLSCAAECVSCDGEKCDSLERVAEVWEKYKTMEMDTTACAGRVISEAWQIVSR